MSGGSGFGRSGVVSGFGVRNGVILGLPSGGTGLGKGRGGVLGVGAGGARSGSGGGAVGEGVPLLV